MAKDGKQEYTDPELRERLKEKIKAGDKGGKKGQWSARKSQLLVQAYEKEGGGYRGPKSGKQKNLERWTEEDWQTEDGSARARGKGGTKRYLPKKAWEQLSEKEKKQTERAKREGSKKGKQHVANTDAAKKARKDAKKLPIDGYEDLRAKDVVKRLGDLTDKQLRKVRDFEKAHAARKTVLQAIENKAG
jgi:hypothetical protein